MSERNAIYEYVFGGLDLGSAPPVWTFSHNEVRITKGPLILTIPCKFLGPLDRYLVQLGDA